MFPVTSKYLTAIANPHRRVAEVTITLPGETEGTRVDIESDDSTVTMSGTDGSRYSASLTLSPDLRSDIFALASVPGAAFRIRSGVDYGGGMTEWIDCGVLYAIEGTRGIAQGEFPLSLKDGSLRQEECRFISPWAIASGTDRSAGIAAMVVDADPDVVITQTAAPQMMGSAVYDRDRLQAEQELANGGNLDAAFTAAGGYLIQDNPILNPAVPAWVLRTGEYGTILPDAERNIPLSRLFNMVIVGAPEAFQTWGAITVEIADPNHPRHRSKIGARPFFISDPTIGSAATASARGRAALVQLLTAVEEISIPTIGNPALEYGDTVAVAHQATENDPGLAANYFTEGWTFNLGTGAMDLTGRSTSQPELEET